VVIFTERRPLNRHLVQTASAQDWAKEKLAKSLRHFEWVTVKHDGGSVDSFVVYPESKDKRPVVLIIHGN
jgi:carboxymethylenebutenolidase